MPLLGDTPAADIDNDEMMATDPMPSRLYEVVCPGKGTLACFTLAGDVLSFLGALPPCQALRYFVLCHIEGERAIHKVWPTREYYGLRAEAA